MSQSRPDTPIPQRGGKNVAGVSTHTKRKPRADPVKRRHAESHYMSTDELRTLNDAVAKFESDPKRAMPKKRWVHHSMMRKNKSSRNNGGETRA